MPRLVTRSLLTVLALLVLFAASSAPGAYARPYEGREATAVLLGNEAVEPHDGHLKDGRAEAFRLQTRTSGITGVLYIYVDLRNTARAVAVGIYSNTDGRPGSLLSKGSGSSLRGHAWSAVSLTPTQLAAGKTYWLALLGEGGTLRYRDRRRGSCPSAPSIQRHLRELPDQWSADGVRAGTACPLSAYVLAAVQAPFLSLPALGPSALPALGPSASLASSGSPTDRTPTERPAPLATAPTDTVAPSVRGSALVGDKLSASSGTWTGSPTSYSYQWQDCSALDDSCLNVSGATASTYKVTASDLESAVRVLVSASNTDGTGEATSETTAPVASAPPPPPPPAPTNTKPPAISGPTVEDETLTASTGTWSGSPTSYTYQWQTCNTSGTSCTNITSATASTRVLTSSNVGHTLRVIVKATNTGGAGEATSEPTATVTSAPPPPPPPAPTNTKPPTISGPTVEDETLTASTGTWSGEPTSYTYQWQTCNTSGTSCTNITGATTNTRALAADNVGHTLRVLVKATNTGGTGEATSEATAIVTAKETGTPKNCFSNPEGCGYPGTKNAGVANCSELKASGSKTITKAETIENTDIAGSIDVEAAGVKLNHDCVVFNGREAEGSAAVALGSAAENFTISNTTVRAENTTSDSFEEAIQNNHDAEGAVASHDRLEDCAECIHQQWTLSESYVIANGRAEAEGTHTEDWWFDNGEIVANDDTLLNPSKQTAVIFAEGSGACDNHEQVTNSLIAGGGFMFYFCTHASSIGKSTIEIKDNRFARRVCTKAIIEDVEGRGGWECSGKPNEEQNYLDAGEGTGAYYPHGGFFGVASESPETFPSNGGAGWEGNYWDDNLEAQGDETK